MSQRDPKPASDDDPDPRLQWWADAVLGSAAHPLLTEPASGCWTGSVAETRVCVLIETSSPDGRRVTDRAVDFAARTGCALVTILIDGGSRIGDALGSHLRAVHRLSGTVPHIAVETGTRTALGRLRAASADIAAAVSFAVEQENPHFGDEQSAINWIRDVLPLLPANHTLPAPVHPPSPGSPIPRADPLAVITAAVDDAPVPLGPVSAGIHTGLARLGGHTIGFAASTVFTGDGETSARDIIATARLVDLCDAYHLPLVIALDTPGLEHAAEPQMLNPLIRSLAESSTPTAVLVTRRAAGLVGTILTDRALIAGEILAWPEAVAPCDADRIIDPARTAEELLTTISRWASVDDPLPERRRAVLAR